MQAIESSVLEPARFARRKIIAGWSLGCVLGIALIWAVVLIALKDERNDATQAAMRETSERAKTFLSQVHEHIANIDQVSLMLRYQWQDLGHPSDITEQYKQGAFLQALALAALNTKGVIIAARSKVSLNTDMSDLPFFAWHKTSTDKSLRINEVQTGRGSMAGKKVIRFTRRIESSDGGFAGVMVVSTATDYLTPLNKSQELNAGDFVSLRFENGSELTGRGMDPNTPPYLEPASNAQKKSSVTLEPGSAFSDGIARFVAFEKMDDYPLHVVAAMTLDNAMAPYVSTANTYKFGGSVISLLLMSAAVLGMMSQLRKTTRQQYLEAVQQTFRLATDSAREAFYIFAPVYDSMHRISAFQIEDCNERAARMSRTTRKELIGKTIAEVYNVADTVYLNDFLKRALTSGFLESAIKIGKASQHKDGWFQGRAIRSGDRIAVTVRDISAIKEQEATLARMATTDALTLLPNRYWLDTHLPKALEQAAGKGSKLGILFIDLDDFKKLNDSHGHKAGDEMLLGVATLLRQIVRSTDEVIRLGGDEFTVLINPLTRSEDLRPIAAEICAALAAFKPENMAGFSGRASIGSSIYPDDASDASSLLQTADMAMYAAKSAGKAQVRHYDAPLAQSFKDRIKTEHKLEQAIAANQMVLYFQPRACCSSGRLCSMEALIRWQDPERGLVGPSEFIAIAEESALILALGDWVAHQACAQLAQWRDAGLACKPVSINVSARQLNNSEFRTRLTKYMRQYRIDHKLLALELTESTMIGDDPTVKEELNALRSMGIELQIDDFGTGYSSLSQLQKLDIDVLKIDQSFVQALDINEQGYALCEAMVSIGKTLKIVVVAEGVETLRQLQLLQSLGCDELQGFLISPPLPAEKMARLMLDDVLLIPASNMLNVVR